MSLSSHCASYYAATINDRTEYPVLKGEETADVCIVGGGFTGISSALMLAEKGYSVALLEEHAVGWGASGRNGGQLIRGLSGEGRMRRQLGAEADDLIRRLHMRGNEIVKENIKKYDIQCDYKPGYINAAFKQRQVQALEESLEFYDSLGIADHFRILGKEEISDYIGTDVYVGGMYSELDGHLHPLNLCRGEARAAAGLGAKIFESSPVTHITHGKKPVVHTANGSVRADKVIIGGNAYHLLERRHLGGFVFPAGTYIIATEPLSEDEARKVMPQDVAVSDENEMLDYYRLSADRRMLYGGQCNYSGREPKDIKKSMIPHMMSVFPGLKGKRIDYEWGGMIGIVVNRIPHVGRIGDNVYYAQGYSGHGINQTHIVGEVLTKAICGQMEDFDVYARARHFRIPAPRWVGNNMVALGMLYYRMKDLL